MKFPLLLLAIALSSIPALFADDGEEAFNMEDEDAAIIMEDEGITVSASRETTQQMIVVSKEEIEKINAPDLAVLLQETAGLGFTRRGPYGNQTEINMRGFDSERIAFLIDGVPVNSALDGDFEISGLDMDAIDHIEVIYGGSDTKYNVSGALGGVINIVTVKQQKPGLRVGANISNTSVMPGYYFERNGEKADPKWQDLADAQKAALSFGLGAEKFSLSANLFADRAANHFIFKEPTYNRIRRKDNNEIYDAGASASFVLNFQDMSKLITSLDFYYADRNIPSSGFSPLVGKQKDFSTRQNLMYDMPRAFHDTLAMEASLSHSWQNLDFSPPSNSGSIHDQHYITMINRWNWYPLSWLTLRAGGDYRYTHMDSTDLGIKDRHNGGIYETAEFKVHKNFLVVESVKLVFDNTNVVPVPKLGFVWTPSDSFTLKNNYFRSFKFPDFEDLFWGNRGNPNLNPEDGWGGDLTGIFRFKKSVRLENTLFYEWTTDSIHWSPGSDGTWLPYNVGEADFFGLDSKIHLDLPSPLKIFEKLGLSFSYQYLLSYLLSYGYSRSSNKRIPYMPMHTAGASLKLPWKTGELGISGRWESQRYANTANNVSLESPFLLDINVNQEIRKNFSAFLVLRNLLNKPYESFDNYFMPGLTATLGMKVKFENER
jgi:outer membrane cobalamin receptor